MRAGKLVGGQVLLEAAALFAAVGLAVLAMTGYINRSMNAFQKATERELNGATEENRP